ncbi:transposase [Pseudarthrobacter equi]|uniref:transposase n=1 Tax=Pseudarthrobacter equi TaxID=728066 RepID=UPI0028D7F6F5|nr:transposase [Pseudarthrobacter equi]
MTTIVDLDIGQVLGIVDGRDSERIGDWMFARPLEWRLSVQAVAIDPLAASLKALDVAATHRCSSRWCHLVKFGNDMLTEASCVSLSRCAWPAGRSTNPRWAIRRLLLRAGDTLSDRAPDRLWTVFMTDDATGNLPTAWLFNEQLRALLATGSLADAAGAKDRLQVLVEVGRAAGDEPALVHGLPLVERDRSPHCHQCDKRAFGESEDVQSNTGASPWASAVR